MPRPGERPPGMTSQETVLDVSGMTCGSCEARIHRALGSLAGIDTVDVQRRAGQVRIRHATGLSSELLAARITAAGYPSQVAG